MLDSLAEFGYVERVRWEDALDGVEGADLHTAATVLERIAAVFEDPRP